MNNKNIQPEMVEQHLVLQQKLNITKRFFDYLIPDFNQIIHPVKVAGEDRLSMGVGPSVYTVHEYTCQMMYSMGNMLNTTWEGSAELEAVFSIQQLYAYKHQLRILLHMLNKERLQEDEFFVDGREIVASFNNNNSTSYSVMVNNVLMDAEDLNQACSIKLEVLLPTTDFVEFDNLHNVYRTIRNHKDRLIGYIENNGLVFERTYTTGEHTAEYVIPYKKLLGELVTYTYDDGVDMDEVTEMYMEFFDTVEEDINNGFNKIHKPIEATNTTSGGITNIHKTMGVDLTYLVVEDLFDYLSDTIDMLVEKGFDYKIDIDVFSEMSMSTVPDLANIYIKEQTNENK